MTKRETGTRQGKCRCRHRCELNMGTVHFTHRISLTVAGHKCTQVRWGRGSLPFGKSQVPRRCL